MSSKPYPAAEDEMARLAQIFAEIASLEDQGSSQALVAGLAQLGGFGPASELPAVPLRQDLGIETAPDGDAQRAVTLLRKLYCGRAIDYARRLARGKPDDAFARRVLRAIEKPD